MTKNTRDILTHSGVAVAMLIIYLLLPHEIAVTVAVIAHWYAWELGQRIVKDAQNRGALYWWNIAVWSNQARWEFLAQALAAIVTVNIYTIIIIL